MNEALQEAADKLRRNSIVDLAGLLDADGREQIDNAIKSVAKRELRAYVLLLPPEVQLTSYRPLWKMLGLEKSRDLLLLYNGPRWEAKGWDLPQRRITRLLDQAEAELPSHRAFAKAITTLAAEAVPVQSTTGSGLPVFVLPGLGVLATGGLIWIIRRRASLAHKHQAAFAEAKDSAEQAYGDVILAAEDLMLEEAAELQLRARDLKIQLDALISKVGGRTQLMGRSTLGKLRHIENELAAIRSTILQKGRP